jgi:hypothetical protein
MIVRSMLVIFGLLKKDRNDRLAGSNESKSSSDPAIWMANGQTPAKRRDLHRFLQLKTGFGRPDNHFSRIPTNRTTLLSHTKAIRQI